MGAGPSPLPWNISGCVMVLARPLKAPAHRTSLTGQAQVPEDPAGSDLSPPVPAPAGTCQTPDGAAVGRSPRWASYTFEEEHVGLIQDGVLGLDAMHPEPRACPLRATGQ